MGNRKDTGNNIVRLPLEGSTASALLDTSTICAVSTPPGMGGIAVVRVSGTEALAIVSRCWQGKDLAGMASHTVHLGNIVDAKTRGIVDQAVLTTFRAPNSFTGEDVVEISCHGSVWIQQQILNTLIDAGCRMATAGEFTQRAFGNGKMDLSQAEAVADVIASSSAAAHRVAMNQMRGAFGKRLASLRERLLHFVALIELELDFSEEDVTFADRHEVIDLANEIHREVDSLASSYHDGNAIRNGVPVAIVGATNAGKSTILNALLGDDRAIVSDIHGTTRDTVEDTLAIGGTLFRLIDTAGIRDTADTIESLGIERSIRKMDEARIVVWVIDALNVQTQVAQYEPLIRRHAAGAEVIAVVNKRDLVGDKQATVEALGDMRQISISAHDQNDVARLKKLIVEQARLPQVNDDSLIVTNARHYRALTRAAEAIARAIQGLHDGIPADLVSQDIRECMHYLGEITGQIANDEILGEIFANFCIGK